MNIVADEQIPYVQEAFGGLGQVTTLPGRLITSSDLRDAHILLVRSITKVNAALLQDTPIQFVGTASAGIDHIDTVYLRRKQIQFASAAGANANSVAEYVVTALLLMAKENKMALRGKTIGIIGVGHIGSLVQAKADTLGMKAVLYDPPLARIKGPAYQSPLDTVLGCDVVTFHVPLILHGPMKTFHFLNEQTVARLPATSLVINTSRGEVIDTQSLLNHWCKARNGATILDVWEHEPDIHWDLFDHVSIGTPHIAGHSQDGKVAGTVMLYKAVCRFLHVKPTWNPSDSLSPKREPVQTVNAEGKSNQDILCELATAAYHLTEDHARMAYVLHVPPEKRPQEFDRLRKEYPIRREFHCLTVNLLKADKELHRQVRGLGFSVVSSAH